MTTKVCERNRGWEREERSNKNIVKRIKRAKRMIQIGFLSNSTIKNVKSMQIGASALKFSIVGKKVSMANAIRRTNIKRIWMHSVDKFRITIGQWKSGYCWIIERKCRIKRCDSVKREEKKIINNIFDNGNKLSVISIFHLFNLCWPDDSLITSLPIIPHMWAWTNNCFWNKLIRQL